MVVFEYKTMGYKISFKHTNYRKKDSFSGFFAVLLRKVRFILIFIALALSSFIAYSQSVAIDTTGSAAVSSAILEVRSTTRGLLIPRMTTVQMNAIATPDTSLMIFNTDNNCIYYWTGPPLSEWQSLYCACISAPPAPGIITGVQSICQGTSTTYSIASVSGASIYAWSVPTGSVITSGQGTTSITITAGATSGNISVTATNSCGTSTADTLVLAASTIHGTATFNYIDGQQTWTVPPCVSVITVSVYGAQGGTGGSSQNSTSDIGGYGGSVIGTLNVVSGLVLNIFVGQQGNAGVMAEPGTGGYNGGGSGFYVHSARSGGGGGGASDIRTGGVALGNRIVVAGGGGGAGCYRNILDYEAGGAAGAATGAAGYYKNVQGGVLCGLGGTAAAGGNGGTSACVAGSGVLGIGGSGCATAKNAGGGGGGGYYGGGAGYDAGGGGGSNYTGGLTSITTNASGTQAGNGEVIIQW